MFKTRAFAAIFLGALIHCPVASALDLTTRVQDSGKVPHGFLGGIKKAFNRITNDDELSPPWPVPVEYVPATPPGEHVPGDENAKDAGDDVPKDDREKAPVGNFPAPMDPTKLFEEAQKVQKAFFDPKFLSAFYFGYVEGLVSDNKELNACAANAKQVPTFFMGAINGFRAGDGLGAIQNLYQAQQAFAPYLQACGHVYVDVFAGNMQLMQENIFTIGGRALKEGCQVLELVGASTKATVAGDAEEAGRDMGKAVRRYFIGQPADYNSVSTSGAPITEAPISEAPGTDDDDQ